MNSLLILLSLPIFAWFFDDHAVSQVDHLRTNFGLYATLWYLKEDMEKICG